MHFIQIQDVYASNCTYIISPDFCLPILVELLVIVSLLPLITLPYTVFYSLSRPFHTADSSLVYLVKILRPPLDN